MSVFTEEEKDRIRYHLGYMATSFGGSQAGAAIQYGIPIPIETMFLVEDAIQVLLTNVYAADRIRRILRVLDNLEEQLVDATCTFAAAKLGEITLRGAKAGETHTDMLEREYVRWATRLADVLGVPLFPGAERFKKHGPGRSAKVEFD